MVESVQQGPAEASDPDGQVDAALGMVQLASLVQGAFAQVAERHELSPLQGRLLCVLAEAPRGMVEMARIFDVEKATITGLVDRAERRGLVERGRVPGDRRAVRVSLTPEGRVSAAEFHAEVTAQLLGLLDPLAAGDRERFRGTLAAITQSAGLTASWGGARAC